MPLCLELMQCCNVRSMTEAVDIPAKRMIKPEDVAEAALLPFRSALLPTPAYRASIHADSHSCISEGNSGAGLAPKIEPQCCVMVAAGCLSWRVPQRS